MDRAGQSSDTVAAPGENASNWDNLPVRGIGTRLQPHPRGVIEARLPAPKVFVGRRVPDRRSSDGFADRR